MDFKSCGDDAGILKNSRLRKLQYMCGTKERFYRLLTLVDADNRSYAEEYCLPGQAGVIRDRTERMLAEGNAMFGYHLPLTGNDVMRLKGLRPGPQVKECMDFLLKLAFVNPLRPLEEFKKHLLGFSLGGPIN